jgi:two-component system, chemotaxis family, protein-glutamate methylesterase/glutaminase
MDPIRVLIVDDAAVVRRVLNDVLSADPELTVVGAAVHGRAALEQLEAIEVDVVVLDVEMPVLDGIATLRALRARDRWLPVIMFSTLTERAASATLEALAAGANDYVTKPTNTGSIAASVDKLRVELLPKIKQLHQRFSQLRGRAATVAAPSSSVSVAPDVAAPAPSTRPTGPTPPSSRPAPGRPASTTPAAFSRPPLTAPSAGASGRPRIVGTTPMFGSPRSPAPAPTPVASAAKNIAARSVDVIAIGVSTGGPNALAELLPQLPADLAVPVLIVQHMPPIFTRLLAERLDRTSQLHVVEAAEGMPINPGTVYIAPGDRHLAVKRAATATAIELLDTPPENSCRPAVDVLFRSAAQQWGRRTLAVVLTGMGHDGLEGARLLNGLGAPIIVQDEPSSVVWGMPGSIVRASLADQILPLDRVAARLIEVAGRRGSAS